VAVIGLSCRFPQAPDPESFWTLLAEGRDALADVPRSRWNARDFDYRELAAHQCALVDRLGEFDPQFFGISPREAAQMDPQQRLFLELAWEAIADAGIPAAGLRGTRTGVYAGVVWHDYARLHQAAKAPITSHTGLGQAFSIIANRVSYFLGLHGPSVALDTACSSSLVAIHLACQSLRTGESSLAIAGGVNAILSPDTMFVLARFGGLSPDSRSKAFDAEANGFGRGEGGGVVLMKRLSDALADGDPVWCIIRGSAVNNDGATNGLSAPSSRAQEMVLRDACSNAGIDPCDLHYVEAHGTGTVLGDPIEAGALGTVFGTGRLPDKPLLVGSVKTNIGHLEGASGIAGFLKAVLAIRHGAIPPNLHFRQPSPLIDFEKLRLRVPTALTPWPEPAVKPLAGVSAFGWGGTNCHIIVEGPEPTAWRDQTAEIKRTCAALHPGAVARGRDPVFVFSPQGSQWWGMGHDLFRTEPAFRATFRECDRLFAEIAGYSLTHHLLCEDWTASGDVSIIQPLIFAMQVSLAALWKSWGVLPAAVVGHSLGEIAAAHVAGILSLEGAVLVIRHYSRLQARLAHGGGMALIELPAEELGEFLGDPEKLCIAGFNSPCSTVVSGEPLVLQETLATLAARGVSCAAIQVNLAAHSPQIARISDELTHCLYKVETRCASIPMISTLTGHILNGLDMDCGYWAKNLSQPVRFVQAVSNLIEAGQDAFVEISPHPILLPAVVQTIARSGRTALALSSLRRRENPRATLGETFRILCESGRTTAPEPRSHVFTVSARSPEALREYGESIASAVQRDTTVPLEDISHTMTARTTHHPYRAAFVASGRDDFLAQISTAAVDRAIERQPLAFVFCGAGSQSWLTGRELMRDQPVFADMVGSCSRILEGYAGWSLLEELSRDESESRLNEMQFAQPAIFAIQVALSALWRSWGIEPDAVVGHSMGEIAAAHIAGVLTLEDATKVITVRSRLVQENAPPGGMLAVGLPLAEAASLIDPCGPEVWIAAVNGPQSVVLSGSRPVLESIQSELTNCGVHCRSLAVTFASHGGFMAHIDRELSESLSVIHTSSPRVPIVSSVTGQFSGPHDFDASYWGRNLKQPVLFAQAVGTLLKEGIRHFLEIGPHPALGGSITECLEEHGKVGVVWPSLRSGMPERATILSSVAELYTSGHDVNWQSVSNRGHFVRLPGYPFQRRQYWFDDDPDQTAKPAPAYEIAWRELNPPDTPPQQTGLPGSWRIVMDRGGVGVELARFLQKRGQHVCGPEDSTCTGIVDLRGLDVPPVLDPIGAVGFATELCAGVVPLLSGKARLWLATRGAESPRCEGANPAAAPLAGFARGISLEYPDLWGGLIDVDPEYSPEETAEALAAELLASDEEDQIALRGKKRYAPRLSPLKLEAEAAPVRTDATYLITGGAGSLGLSLAHWLAARGARHLVLTGRSGLRAENAKDVRQLESLGVQVLIATADISDRASMLPVFQRIESSFPPLRGVFHAAGILTRYSLGSLEAERIADVLRPKIAGALILDELTASAPLDFFVLFSSGASIWGSKNLGHYAAANRFLDSFAAYRRGKNRPATSINWGAWEAESMASAADKTAWAAVGVHAMPRSSALESLGRILANEIPNAVVAQVDWSVFKSTYQSRRRRHLLDEIRISSNESAPPNTNKGSMRERMAAVASTDRGEFLRQYVRDGVAHILGFARAVAVEPDRGFFDMGMDSLMALALRRRIENDFDCSLPGTVAFDYPTVNALSGLLARTFAGAQFPPANGKNIDRLRVTVKDFAQASEAELEILLDKKLDAFLQKRT
jgi:acyl transferase domain-containing protein/acyl carrier protein